MLFSSRISVRVRFSVWLISDFARAFILHSVITVTLPDIFDEVRALSVFFCFSVVHSGFLCSKCKSVSAKIMLLQKHYFTKPRSINSFRSCSLYSGLRFFGPRLQYNGHVGHCVRMDGVPVYFAACAATKLCQLVPKAICV